MPSVVVNEQRYDIDPDDNWVVALEPEITETDWFQVHDGGARSRFAQRRISHGLDVAKEFETGLIQGLEGALEKAAPRSPQARFIPREIAEEVGHSELFTAVATGLGCDMPIAAAAAVNVQRERGFRRSAQFQPQNFWFLTIAGEQPIDVYQRDLLIIDEIPEVLRAVMALHVREESAHLAYAKARVRDLVPSLKQIRTSVLVCTLRNTIPRLARRILLPPGNLLREYGCPDPVALRQAVDARIVTRATAPTWKLAETLGLGGPPPVSIPVEEEEQ